MTRSNAVHPAIAQLEERRFVIGNWSKTTLGPVFESRWLDLLFYKATGLRHISCFDHKHYALLNKPLAWIVHLLCNPLRTLSL